jgi:UDP-N-acetylglucosamine diphosphorylase/glucosamine-1-phosphate N-acetyltransferase
LKAVILAAGEGNRMRPLTYGRPKVMLPLANQPILEHLLIQVREAGIGELIFVVGYHDEQVRGYFGDGRPWGVRIEYCTQRRQLGTANALGMVEGLIDGSFLVLNGDAIIGAREIAGLADGSGHALGVIQVEDAYGLGVVELEAGRVVRIYEKVARPPSRLVNAGLYRFTPDIFSAVAQTAKSPRGEYELTDTLQLMIDRGQPLTSYEVDRWLNLSYPWDLLSANEALLAEMETVNSAEIEENVVLKGPVSVGKNTVIRSGSYLVGPVAIGDDCELGPNCVIRPNTAIGDRCHIGSAVEIKGSIVMNGSKIPHHSYVGDSVIGEDCNLGAGTKIANLRLDGKNIEVAGTDTGRRKLGAIIGDRVETGINASVNVGTVIGSGARIGPGAVAQGVISPGAQIL